MNPGDVDYRDLKLAIDSAGITIASGLRVHKPLLLVRKRAPLEKVVLFGGATYGYDDNQSHSG